MEPKKYFYYYHKEDKYYIGKELIKSSNYGRSGELLIPGHATTIIPPEQFQEGYIPVFDVQNKKWDVKKDDFWRYEVIDYPDHFDDFPINQIPQLYRFNTLGVMENDNSIRLNTVFIDIPYVVNGLLIMMRFISRINIVNMKINELYHRHNDWLTPNRIHSVDSLIGYKLVTEDIIHHLKKLLDEFIISIYIHDNYEAIKLNHKMEIDDYGERLFATKEKPVIANLKKVINFDKYKSFLYTVKELDNGFKHNLTPAESDHKIGLYAPTVILYKYKHGSLKSFTKYNVYVGGLIEQFNRFFYEYMKKLSTNG